MSGKKPQLNNIDTAWWRMEDPTNLMMVTGIMAFAKPITYENLRTLLEKRLLLFDRFRQVVKDPSPTVKAPFWEEAEVDLDYHLIQETLSGKGGRDRLRERTSELMSLPLDYTRPLWQVHLIGNVGIEGNAVVIRTHHCIADGMALVAVMLNLTASSAEDSLKLDPDETSEPRRLSSAGNIFRMVGKAAASLISTVTDREKIVDVARLGGSSALTTIRLLMKRADPPSRFKGELGVPKLPVWSRPIPLEDVKAIKNALGGTVNDVLLSAMTGGLRRYLIGKGDDVTGLRFRAAVPVNLRPPGRVHELGNQFGLVFLTLPVGIENPLERIAVLKRRMNRLKKSPEAIVAMGILKAIGMTPIEIQRIMVNVFGAKTTAVITNVPGPPEPLYMAGEMVDTFMFWVPQSGRVGLGISILSYAGKVRLGVVTDAGLIPDPELIIEGFYKELEDMMTLVNEVEE